MGGAIPFGAEQRLLPEWIPLSFFAFALICQPLGWLLAFLQADQMSDFAGGFGPVLASLHMFTIGVIMTTALGASLQMLPVASATTMSKPNRVVFVLIAHLLGTTIILGGFSHYLARVTTMGLSGLVFASVLYVFLLFKILWHAQGLEQVRRHAFFAALSLLVVISLATMIILDWADFITLPLQNARSLHGGFALFGFMGFLVLGFSRIMIPMLAVSDKTNERLANLTFIFALAGIALWASDFATPALMAGLVASVLHIYEMGQVLKARLMRRLGPEWHLIRFSWVMLPVSLALMILGFWQVGVACAVLGWLLSFVLGILQRIIPFLLSMQIARKTGMPELPSKLATEKLLKTIAPVHIGCVLMFLLALGFDQDVVLKTASLIGIINALLFLSFFIIALKRKHQSLEKMTS